MNIESRIITLEEALPVRIEVLRKGLDPTTATFKEDHMPDAFHTGLFADDKLVSVASYYPQSYEEYNGSGYRLRGMATLEEYQGKSLGTKLLDFGMDKLKDLQADYIWCNARVSASVFYNKYGFEIISDEFDISPIGPHYVMLKKL